ARLMALRRRNAPTLVFGAALLLMTIVLVVAQWRITFFQDTFAFLLDRQPWTPHSFLFPHNEHIVILPVVVTKVLLAIFGMSSNVPEQIAMGATVLGVDILLFVWLRRRVDPWLAVIGAVLFLFLGSAWPTILWPFENEFTLPVLFGLAGLLLLEREDRKGDTWACAMFVLGTISGSLGVCFIAAAFVDLILKREERGWRRAYVFAVPLLVYLAWYAGWGHEAEHHITLYNVLHAPQYVVEGFASSLDSLAGLSTITANVSGNNDWGRPLVIGMIGLLAFAQWRRPGFSRTFWVVTAAAVAYWLLAAFDFVPGREASAARYVYAGAFFTLLMIAELLRRWPFSRKALWVAALVAACAIGPNLAQMKEGSSWEREQSVFTRADLGALEIARDTASPYYSMGSVETTGTASLALVNAGLWFEAVDKWGSPADSPSQIETEQLGGRQHADLVLAEVLPVTSTAEAGGLAPSAPAGEACTTLPAGESADKEVELKPGKTTVEVASGDPVAIALRRFATESFPVPVLGGEGGVTTVVNIPKDRATQPWFMHVEAGQTIRVCTGT
ncbi:MAG TPA: hypothetical protein VIJ21_02490, partial [Solirubrobacterales bacterium]